MFVEADGNVDAVQGIRSGWLDLPADVRAAVSRQLGAPVVAFERSVGGFSDGVAGVVATSGPRAFIKAVPAASAAAEDYRTEVAVNQRLPAALPTPRLQFSFEQDDWVLLCFDELDGRHPGEPWRTSELVSVLDSWEACGSVLRSLNIAGLPTVADRMQGRCGTWRALAGVGSYGRLTVDDLSPWERPNLDRLAQVEDGWQRHVAGAQLLHFDLRFDNMMLSPIGGVWFLDWGRACTGPGWVDLVCLLLESDLGRINPERLFLSRSPGKSADPEAVDAFLVALASNWMSSADQASPTHAPHLQSRRVRSRDQTLAWLRRRWS